MQNLIEQRSNDDLAGQKTRKYTEIPPRAVDKIREISPFYGSQSRTLQVATEILIRQKKPIKVKYRITKKDGKGTMASFKLLPRTIELIDRLAPVYGTRGRVIAACANVLEHPA